MKRGQHAPENGCRRSQNLYFFLLEGSITAGMSVKTYLLNLVFRGSVCPEWGVNILRNIHLYYSALLFAITQSCHIEFMWVSDAQQSYKKIIINLCSLPEIFLMIQHHRNMQILLRKPRKGQSGHTLLLLFNCLRCGKRAKMIF